MNTKILSLTLALTCGLFGCDSGPDEASESSPSETSSATTTSSASTDASDASSGSEGGSGTTGDATTGSTTADSDTGNTEEGSASGDASSTTATGDTGTTDAGDTTDTTDTGAGECELSGDDCGDCMAMNCCAEIQECLTDTVCTCFQECAAANPDDAIGCAGPTKCDIPLPSLLDQSTVLGRMSTCTQMNCVQCL